MVNFGCIDLNPWASRVGRIDRLDYLVIDLDPSEVAFDVVTAGSDHARPAARSPARPGLPRSHAERARAGDGGPHTQFDRHEEQPSRRR